MSEASTNLNSNKVAIAAVGVLAAGALLGGGYYLTSRNSKPKPSPSPQPQTNPVVQDTNIKKPEDDENYKKAQAVKEQGNGFFKLGKYEEAIESYTQAIALSNIDTHLIYSNRSAAFLSTAKVEEAIDDAKKCIALKPDWSKGYFRLGKGLAQRENNVEAFINFYKGLSLDPKSDELKKMVDQIRAKLPPFGEKAFKFLLQTKQITRRMTNVARQLCKDLDASYDAIEASLASANANNIVKIYESNELINRCYKKDPIATLRILGIILLLVYEKYDAAKVMVDDLLLLDSSDPQICILAALTFIRYQSKGLLSSIPDAVRISEFLREALIKQPDDLFIITTYAGYMATTIQVMGAPDNFSDIGNVLKELKIALNHPVADKITIAHTGIQFWFRLFDNPQLQMALMNEEREAEASGLSPSKAYLRGLISGAFRSLIMEPFFLQAMSEVVLPLPQLERILMPFRTALLALEDVEWDVAAPFVLAVDLQMWRNCYLWETKDEERLRLKEIEQAINQFMDDIEKKAAPGGVLNKKLLVKLALYAMYFPLRRLKGIEELCLAIDLTRLPSSFVELLNKCVFSVLTERDVCDTQQIIALTSIPKTDLVQYFNSHVSPLWDSPPISPLAKFSFADELKWRYPYYNPRITTDQKLRVLVAGCGTGKEIYQLYSSYDNVDITTFDISETNLAYAYRQNQELGVQGVKYFLADVMGLTPTQFPGQFDIIVANDFLHYTTDPVKAWEKLNALLKKGGYFMATVHNTRLIKMIASLRKTVASSFDEPVFDKSDPPRVIRYPSDDEVRAARQTLLDIMEQQAQNSDGRLEVSPELSDLVSTLGFYTLSEFRDLVFHPMLQGFTFTAVAEIAKKMQLNLIGFDFPEIFLDRELMYKAEYYEDRNMTNPANLDAYDNKDPTLLNTFYISFTCEKL